MLFWVEPSAKWSVYHAATLVATLGLRICWSLICFVAPWQPSFCLSPRFCVDTFSGTPRLCHPYGNELVGEEAGKKGGGHKEKLM